MQSATDISLKGESSVTELQNELQRCVSGHSNPSPGGDLFDIVSFQKGNFVQSWHPPVNASYHAILW